MSVTEADLNAMTRAQLDELAGENGLDPADYPNKSAEIAALAPLVTQEVPVTETTDETTESPPASSASDTGGIDPMLVDPVAVQKEALAGTTSDPSTHVEGYALDDVKPDPSTATDKASDAENYSFPQGGDVDIALIEPVVAEGETWPGLNIEDWVVLDGAADEVPDALDGRRAVVLNVEMPDDPVPVGEEGNVFLTVRTRDDYAATLHIPFSAVKEVQKRGVSPVR